MAKATGPLFSLEASGSIAKTITYGKNLAGAWVRFAFKKAYTRTTGQDILRSAFSLAMAIWGDKKKEEQFLWYLALKNYKAYSRGVIDYISRTGRCLFLHNALPNANFEWNGSPFPPSLIQIYATDEVADFEELKADMELITGLSFCRAVEVYFMPYLGEVQTAENPHFGETVAGIASNSGGAIAIGESYYNSLSDYEKRRLIAHELTHILMTQHEWRYVGQVVISETIADEVAVRVAQADLTPVYTFQGKTLSEWVPNSICS